MTLRVAAFTCGRNVPSARYRVRALLQPLSSHGVAVSEMTAAWSAYPPEQQLLRPVWLAATLLNRLPHIVRSYRHDVTLLQRGFVSTLPTLEWSTRAPRVLDVDDAIYRYRNGVAARSLARWSDLVVCGNDHLAERFSDWNQNIEIIPTAVDTARFRPADEPKEDQRVIIGWVGTYPNLRYLLPILPALKSAVTANPDIRVRLITDRFPVEVAREIEGVEFVKWSAEREVEDLQAIDIGIMPLADGDWERGKCSFKMLQYMACGKPVVVSPVGMNRQLLARGAIGEGATTPQQWTDALLALAEDHTQRQAYGQAGRKLVSTDYSTDVVARKLAGLLKGVV